MELDPRLPLAAVSRREDPRDVLVLPAGATEWDRKKPIGCASARRKLQLQRLYPDASARPWEIQSLIQQGYRLTGDASLNDAPQQ